MPAPIRRVWHSLQCRLMTISTTAAISVLCSASGIATWRLHQDLITTGTVTHSQAIAQFLGDANTYQEMYSEQVALQRAVDKYTRSDRWFRVLTPDGQLVAISQPDTWPDVPPVSLQGLSETPHLVEAGPYQWILCEQQLVLRDGTRAKVQTISDVTGPYRVYQTFLQTLLAAGGGSLLVATVAGLWLIRRSLRPLRHLSRVVEMVGHSGSNLVATEQLQQTRAMLADPPTEVAQLADAFLEMLNRLAWAWGQEQQLLSNLSHELRTPLAVVQGYLESTLRRGQNLTEIQAESLSISLEETQRVVRLLRDLLDLARTEAGAFRLNVEPVRLNVFAQEVVSIARQLGSNPLQLEAVEVMVRADRDRLKQVLLNLLTNAIRYSDPARPIVLRVGIREKMALLQVEDQGIGIASEHLPHIFERFYRVSEARHRGDGGIGLGLAITKALVEHMGGRIAVASELGVGTTFSVVLPILEADRAWEIGV